MLRIFIGYDEKEVVAYHTLCHSIITRASVPVSFTPLYKQTLSPVFIRENDSHASTDFSFSRFIVPYLSNYEGCSLYMDCDMVVTCDIKELFDLFDSTKALQVVKHNYVPKSTHKFLNQKQTTYEKKNWSSVMLFNNEKCHALTPEVIETAEGLDLHQFKWLENESLVGELPETWNYLVDEYPDRDELPAIIHYTLGGPYFSDTINCDFSTVWLEEYQSLSHPFIE
jgi:lipopolysaccharide biosynthesis glycosyltransferase